MSDDSQLSRVRFDELAVFVEVAEAGSIAEAARRRGVPKSTIGRALARVEESVGSVLVRRMARGPALTESGRMLAALAAPHIAALRDATTALSRESSEIQGVVRVTAPSDIGQMVLAPLVATFIARHPRVIIEMDMTMRLVDLATEGVDLGLRILQRSLASNALIARKLARLDLGLYAGASYLLRRGAPRRREDLEDHDHVLFQGKDGRAVLHLESPEGSARLKVSGRVGANDFICMREAIVAGAGIGPLPWFVANGEIASGRLVRVLPDHRLGGTTAYLVNAPAKPLPKKVEVFRAFLLEQAPRLLLGTSAP